MGGRDGPPHRPTLPEPRSNRRPLRLWYEADRLLSDFDAWWDNSAYRTAAAVALLYTDADELASGQVKGVAGKR
jgi:hypothetical protein